MPQLNIHTFITYINTYINMHAYVCLLYVCGYVSVKEQIWLPSVKYLWLSLNTSWAWALCIDSNVWNISNVIGMNKKKQTCLPDKEYVTHNMIEQIWLPNVTYLWLYITYIDHNILLKILENKFRITDIALKWFESYFRPRSFKGHIGDEYSESQNIKFWSATGVLQWNKYLHLLLFLHQ